MKKILMILGGIIVIGAVVFLGFIKGGFKLGKGMGDGEESGDFQTKVDNSKVVDPVIDNNEASSTVIIKIDENKITIDGKVCEDCDALKGEIIAKHSEDTSLQYVFEHEYALKETYDAVKSILLDLEGTLGIKVNYND